MPGEYSFSRTESPGNMPTGKGAERGDMRGSNPAPGHHVSTSETDNYQLYKQQSYRRKSSVQRVGWAADSSQGGCVVSLGMELQACAGNLMGGAGLPTTAQGSPGLFPLRIPGQHPSLPAVQHEAWAPANAPTPEPLPLQQTLCLQPPQELQGSGRSQLSSNGIPDTGLSLTWGDQELRNQCIITF